MEHQKILIICAHPDDIEFRCAGSAARWTREGRQVEYCLATSGDKGVNGPEARRLTIDDKRAIRESEQRAAAAVVGVEQVYFLRHTDGEVRNTAELRRDLVRVMRECRPDLVVADDPANDAFDSFYGYHRDHRAVAKAVFDALYPAVGNENYFPELLAEGLEPHHPREAWFKTIRGADTWVDITDTFDLKIKALHCHKSQVGAAEDLVTHLRDWAKRSGEAGGLECAESYRRMEVPG